MRIIVMLAISLEWLNNATRIRAMSVAEKKNRVQIKKNILEWLFDQKSLA